MHGPTFPAVIETRYIDGVSQRPVLEVNNKHNNPLNGLRTANVYERGCIWYFEKISQENATR